MRVLLICVGSRGDAEPFCSLAAQLLKENNNGKKQHSIDFFIQPELQELAPKHPNLNIHLLPFTQFDFYKFAGNPTKGLDNPNPRVKFVGIVTDIIAQLVFPFYEQVWNVVKSNGTDVIVTSALARSLAFAIAEKAGIPSCLIHLQPLVPTDLFPHYSNTDEFVECLMSTSPLQSNPKYVATYWELEKYQHEFLEPDLNKLYDNLELPRLDFAKTQSILSGDHPDVWLANCFYDALIPQVDTVNGTKMILHIGALADAYIPSDFEQPDDEFCGFLQEKRPICVGFGSMPFSQVQDIVSVLKELNRDAVFVGKALALPFKAEDNGGENNNEKDDDGDGDADTKAFIKEHIRQVSSLPYAWLLPQCCMMLSHGGAGVIHATLRAGIPPVIAPLIGDQFFFAKLLAGKGLGACAGTSLPTVTKEEWKAAINAALECIDTARDFGTNIKKQDKLGVELLVNALEEKIVVSKM